MAKPVMRGLTVAVAITLLLSAGSVHALVIYRFGGEDQAPPPEADSAGVQYIQVPWADVDPAAGGAQLDLDLSTEAIRPERRDPLVNITPTIEELGGVYLRPHVNQEVWDGDTSTVWVANRYLCAEFLERNYFLSCTDDFGTPGTANITLGGLYQLDRIRVVSGLRDPAKTVQAVRIFLAQEMPATSITSACRGDANGRIPIRSRS